MSDLLTQPGGLPSQPRSAIGMAPPPRSMGLVRLASPTDVAQVDTAESEARAEAERPLKGDAVQGLAGYIRRQFETMKRHRQSGSGWNDRLLKAQRQFNGEYDAETMAAIRAFGGSEVFARIVSVKCRGASAMLREVYLGGQRSWAVQPTPDPKLPDSVSSAIDTLIDAELAGLQSAGQPVDEAAVTERRRALTDEAARAARDRARREAMNAERRLDDLLVEGQFYTALADFLSDIPLYPFACIKGPVVQMAPTVKWENRRAVQKMVPKMFWRRISPFDLWWSGGAGSIEQADVVELQRLSRADLNTLLDVPGYDSKMLLGILEEYPNGHREAFSDATDTPRADAESREDPNMNESGMYDCLEFHGSVQGRLLIEAGMPKNKIKDQVRDYCVQAWMIGNKVIKVQLTPSPRKRHPYFITSFEKIPGTVVGNAIPDIISDIQDVCNAVLRALVNNMSMASGPQVVVNVDMLADGENPFQMYPWKRWLVESKRSLSAGSNKPIEFFQPDSHIQELLAAYKELSNIADELSAIPRYLTGSGSNSSIGRTASGLAMLMNNASKVLQTVASNIDRDVMSPMLQMLYDILMLTDADPEAPGALRGDESIQVKGVAVAIQRETERQRQIELLQATANPIDSKIMGLRGRARLLRSVSTTTGLDGEHIVPPDEQIAAMERAEQAAAMGGGVAGMPPPGADAAQPGGGGGGGGSGGPPSPPDMQSVGAPGRPPGAVASQLGRSAQGSQRGGAQTGPARGTGPRVNLYERKAAA